MAKVRLLKKLGINLISELLQLKDAYMSKEKPSLLSINTISTPPHKPQHKLSCIHTTPLPSSSHIN